MAVLGVWMWPQSVRIYGAQAVVRHCARMGVTDIYFLTKGLAGTVSGSSTLAPQVCERDLLNELLSAAHAAGLRVHAWLTSASDEHYKELHPQSGRCHLTRGRDRGLISLTDEGYLHYMERFVQDLCSRYDIDGLHLDYIRYNHLLYGWSAFALAFAEERQLSLLNTHESPITAIQPGPEGSLVTLDSALAPGEERRITLSSVPETVRVFTVDAEVCVHLLH